MELYWICYYSKATHVRNAWKITFFLLIWNLKNVRVSSRIKDKKLVWLIQNKFFNRISDMGCFRVIQNSVQFHSECSILSTNNIMTQNESKTDFLQNISKDFVCIFQRFWFFSENEAEWKSNLENDLLYNLIYIYQKSKCE